MTFKKKNKTIIMITHDLRIVKKYASKTIELKDGKNIRNESKVIKYVHR